MGKNWIKRWNVPSASRRDKTYTVALADDGSYGCTCPAWKFRREHLLEGICKHIRQVQDGEWPEAGSTPPTPPEFVLAQVREVTPVYEGAVITEVLVPLIPFNETHFQATVLYDCLRYGVPWGQLKERYTLAKNNGRRVIIEYVRENGRCIYGEYIGSGNHAGYEYRPAPVDDGL